MAQSSSGGPGIMEVLLIGGAAWIGWNIYQSYLAAQYAAAVAATPAPGMPATPVTPQIVIPANFTVTPDINDSFRGQVTYNGSPTTFNLIFSGGQATGKVFNSSGTDVTAQLGAANVSTLVNAFNSAVQNELIVGTITQSTPGMSGLGQVRRMARVAVPRLVVRRRIGVEG